MIKANKDMQVTKKKKNLSLISSIMFRKFKHRKKKKEFLYKKVYILKNPMKTYLKEIGKIYFVVI